MEPQDELHEEEQSALNDYYDEVTGEHKKLTHDETVSSILDIMRTSGEPGLRGIETGFIGRNNATWMKMLKELGEQRMSDETTQPQEGQSQEATEATQRQQVQPEKTYLAQQHRPLTPSEAHELARLKVAARLNLSHELGMRQEDVARFNDMVDDQADNTHLTKLVPSRGIRRTDSVGPDEQSHYPEVVALQLRANSKGDISLRHPEDPNMVVAPGIQLTLRYEVEIHRDLQGIPQPSQLEALIRNIGANLLDFTERQDFSGSSQVRFVVGKFNPWTFRHHLNWETDPAGTPSWDYRDDDFQDAPVNVTTFPQHEVW